MSLLAGFSVPESTSEIMKQVRGQVGARQESDRTGKGHTPDLSDACPRVRPFRAHTCGFRGSPPHRRRISSSRAATPPTRAVARHLQGEEDQPGEGEGRGGDQTRDALTEELKKQGQAEQNGGDSGEHWDLLGGRCVPLCFAVISHLPVDRRGNHAGRPSGCVLG